MICSRIEPITYLQYIMGFESEGQYREKLETLKESYFSEKKSPVTKTETLSEGVDESGSESHSNSMSAYMRTLGSFGKN